jgi:autotransporter-associated beta strand protein
LARACASLTASTAAFAALGGLARSAWGADAANNVNLNATDLGAAASYSSGNVPTTGNDTTFVNGVYGSTTFTLTSGSITTGTLDDLDTTQSLIINDAGNDANSITLSTLQNSTTGSAAQDLLYVASGGNLSIAQPIILGVTGGNFDIAANAAATISGIISGSTSTFTLTQTGTGNLTLNGSAANTYTGNTTVNGGTLTLNYANYTGNNLLASTGFNMGGGALNVLGNAGSTTTQSFTTTTINSASNVIFAGPGAGSLDPNLSLGTLKGAIGGTLEFVGAATSTAASTASGQSGSGGSGSGFTAATATITATNGGTTSGGTLVNAVNGGYATVGLYDFAGLGSGTNGAASGTIVGLSQLNTGTAGDGGYSLITTGAPSTSLATDVLGNLSATAAHTVYPALRFNENASQKVNFGGAQGDWTTEVLVTPNVGAFNDSLTTSGGGYFVFGTDSSGANSGTIWQNNTGGFLTIGTYLGGGGTSDAIIKAGPGTVVWANVANTFGFGGAVYLDGGLSEVSGNASVGSASSAATVTLNGGTLVGTASFTMDNGGGANPRPFVLGNSGGGLGATGSNTLTIDGLVTGAAGTGPLTIGIPASAANNNVLGGVPGTGNYTTPSNTIAPAANTQQLASGTLVLSNTANTYTGGTVLDSGILQLNSSNLNVLGTGGITLNGGTFQWGSVSTDISTRLVTLASSGAFDTGTNTVSLANAIGNGGAGGFTKLSSGSLTLNGANTFLGPVTVSAGTLTFTAHNVYSGATSLNGGTLNVTSTGSLGNTPITAASGTTFNATPGAGNIQIGSTAASLTLNAGSSFSMADGSFGTVTFNSAAVNTSVNLLTLNGTGTGSLATNLTFDVGATSAGATLSADELIVNNGQATFGTAGAFNNIRLDLGSNAPAGGNVTLISVPNGGLVTSDFNLFNSTPLVFGTTSYNATLANSTSTALILTLTPVVTQSNYYFTGTGNTAIFGDGGADFATDHTGATPQTGAPGASNNLFFVADSASSNSPSLDTNGTVNSVSFTGTGTNGTNPVTLSTSSASNVLTINASNAFTNAGNNTYAAGVGLVTQVGAAADTISANLALGNSQTWEIDSANPLTVSGNITDGINGSTRLTKTGSGTLVLSGADTYSGGTTISAGTIQLGSSTGLPSTGTLTVSGTGTFDLNGNNVSVPTLADGGVSTGTVTDSGNVATLTINNSATDTFRGSITGNVALVAGGSSTLTLSGINTYGAGTTVSSGTLVAASNSALGNSTSSIGGLTMSGSAVVDFTSLAPAIASLTGVSTNSVVLGNATGSGAPTTLTVGGGNTSTTFAGVISDLSGSAGLAVGNLSVTGNGTLILSGANTFTGTTVVGGNATLQLGSSAALQDSTLNYNNQGGNLSFGTLTSATLAGLTGNQALTLTNATPAAVALTFAGARSTTYTGTLGGNGSVTMNGSGTIIIGNGTIAGSGGAAYTGATSVNLGTLQLGGVAVMNSTSNITITTTTPAGSSNLIVTDAGNITTTGTLDVGEASGGDQTVTLCTLVVEGSAQLTVGNLTFGTGVGRQSAGDSVTIANSAVLTVNGAFNLAHTLEAVSTVVNLNGGTLAVNNFIANNSASTLNLNGGTLQAIANDSPTTLFLPVVGGLTANVDSGGANINTNGFNVTIAQNLVHGNGTPDGGLTKFGNGTLTLTGTNTYNGLTSVTNGTLAISSVAAGATAQSLGEGGNVTLGVASTSSGILDYTGAGGTLGKNISALGNGSDTIENTGSGLLTLSGTLAKNGTTLTLEGGSSGITVSGNITGANANSDLVVNGGTTNLTGTNTYNGPTDIINGGLLNANAAGAIPSNSPVNLDVTGAGSSTLALGANQSAASLAGPGATSIVNLGGSNLTLTGSGTTTYAGTVTDGGSSGSLTMAGSGTQILTGANTYHGGTTISSGTLRGNGASAFGSGAVTINGGNIAVGDGVTSTAQTLTTSGGQNWNSGGGYAPRIFATTANNPPLNDSDILTTGAVTLGASDVSPFTVTATGATGSLDGNVSYQWQVATISNLTGYTDNNGALPTSGQTEVVATAGQTGTQFALNVPATLFGANADPETGAPVLELIGTAGGYDLDIAYSYSAAPEPGTAMLVLAGGLPMLLARRRRKSTNAAAAN